MDHLTEKFIYMCNLTYVVIFVILGSKLDRGGDGRVHELHIQFGQ